MTSSMEVGTCYWLTGLPGAGKTTLACAFLQRLRSEGRHACVLDADVLRQGINRDLGFSPEDRSENVRRIAEVAHLFVTEGFVAIVAAPVDVCMARDPKGLHLRARQGAAVQVTGVSAPYERPQHPDVVLATAALSLDTCADALLRHLGNHVGRGSPRDARPGLNPATSDLAGQGQLAQSRSPGGDR